MKTKTPLVKAFETMGIAHKNLSKTVNGITGTNYITIYNVLKESGVKFTKQDCARIGAIIAETSPIAPLYKIQQTEVYGNRTHHLLARSYPIEAKEKIERVSANYFSAKYLITVK